MLLTVFDPHVFNRRKLAAWHSFYADSKFQATYRVVAGPFDHTYLTCMTDLCRRLIADGGYDDLDASRLAKGLRSMTDGLCLDWLISPRSTSRAEARQICLQALQRSFPGHFPLTSETTTTARPAHSEAAA